MTAILCPGACVVGHTAAALPCPSSPSANPEDPRVAAFHQARVHWPTADHDDLVGLVNGKAAREHPESTWPTTKSGRRDDGLGHLGGLLGRVGIVFREDHDLPPRTPPAAFHFRRTARSCAVQDFPADGRLRPCEESRHRHRTSLELSQESSPSMNNPALMPATNLVLFYIIPLQVLLII